MVSRFISLSSTLVAMALLTSCLEGPDLAYDEAVLEEERAFLFDDLQTEVADSRNAQRVMRKEMEILEARLKQQEEAIDNVAVAIGEKLEGDLTGIEVALAALQQRQGQITADLRELAQSHGEQSLQLGQARAQIVALQGGLESNVDQFRKALDAQLALIQHQSKERKATTGVTYKVKVGDSLEKIAKAHKTSPEEIKKVNQLITDLIYPDQELKIP